MFIRKLLGGLWPAGAKDPLETAFGATPTASQRVTTEGPWCNRTLGFFVGTSQRSYVGGAAH